VLWLERLQHIQMEQAIRAPLPHIFSSQLVRPGPDGTFDGATSGDMTDKTGL